MTPSQQGTSIPERFREVVRQRGTQPAIVGSEPDWTFADLDRASDAVAAALARAEVGVGDRVALYCPNSAQFVISYLGILKAYATLVPINLMLSPREIGFILGDAGAKVLIYHASLAPAVDQVRKAGIELSLAVSIGDTVAGGDPRLEKLMEQDGAPPPAEIDPAEQLAAILYTSGTTGRPKGAMLTHHNLLSNTRSTLQALGLEPGRDRLLVVLPMFHAFAATVGLLTPLLHGLSFVPLARFEPKPVSAAIQDHGVTVFLGVPSMYSLLLRMEDEAVAQWSSVRFCVSGGAAMPGAVMAAFEERFGVPILEGDGPTECSPVTCVNPPTGIRRPGSVGIPIPGVEMRVADPEGASLAHGEHGEICVRGPNVMKGYWGLPEETRDSFFGDWFRTGDLGFRDPDGYFFLVDRIKDLIITNGMNVYPRMVEEVLYRHPDVVEAAVVGAPHELHGEIPIAFVLLKPEAGSDASTLKIWCKEYLGRHELPRRILVRDSLPKNAAGKILKRELRRHGELERGIDHPTETDSATQG